MYKQRRRQLSQNFIYNRKLIRYLVGRSSISKNDTLLEIGPGKGFLTAELLKVAGTVIAVELDAKLVLHLKKFFVDSPSLQLYHLDILDFQLPDTPFKVFANTPFAIEGKIARKLLSANNPPQDVYLIVRKDLAERLSGFTHENQFSLKHKLFWEFSIVHRFRRRNFIPVPNVDSVLWRIERSSEPLIPLGEKKRWENLIDIGFGQGESLKKNMMKLMEEQDFYRMCDQLKIDPKTKPSYLSLEQWVGIYLFNKEKARDGMSEQS